MKTTEDPRYIATRNLALDAAFKIFHSESVLAVTHASVSLATGISRSTLYRHWPHVEQLRKDAMLRVARPPVIAPKTNGPLKADLNWMLGLLMAALNETPWGKIAPQMIATAATDEDARSAINGFMADRKRDMMSVFEAAEQRGELTPDAPVENLIEMAISVPYHRKLVAGLPLDYEWLDGHVETLCRLALRSGAAD